MRSFAQRTVRRALWLAGGFVILIALTPVARCQTSTAAQPAPPKLSPETDPNNPFASNEERIRRQEALIRQTLAANRARIQERNDTAAQQNRNTLLTPPPATGARGAPRPAVLPGRRGGPARPVAPAAPAKADPFGKSSIPFVSFFLSPASSVVAPGDRFAVSTGLSNPDALRIDSFQVVLNYPPGVLRPVAIHQDQIAPLLAGEPETSIDEAAGVLFYRGKLAEPMDAGELPLIEVEWEALKADRSATIKTGFGGHYSGAFQSDKFISASSLGVEDAQLGALVRVIPKEKGLPGGMQFFNASAADAAPSANPLTTDLADAPLPRLWIDQPASGTLQPGQWIVIDLGIDNPGETPIDEIRLAGSFDPQAVVIADSDRANWIIAGRNLLDGPFKTLWPWDLQFNNEIDQAAGTFYYRMGALEPIVHRSAPIARIFAEVKKETQAPVIRWIWNADAPVSRPQTGIFRLNRNLYADRLDLGAPKLAAMTPQTRADGYEKADASLYRNLP